MKVSIITICFNSAITLERTILSVINQNVDNIEYLVIDGASTDGTVSIIKKYDKYITKWTSEKDNGISDAFNKAIRLATGDLICLLNSDDELLPNTVKMITELAKPDADIIHGNIIVHKIDKMQYICKPSLDYSLLLKKSMILNHPGMFIAKRAYQKFGLYNMAYRCAMDRELLARMYSKNAVFQYIDTELVVFYQGGESTKNFLRHAIPEDFKISISYGANYILTILFSVKKIVLFSLPIIKKKILNIFK